MNVESLHVENFKSIREVDVEFSDLNVFVGRNAAGKSNLFEVFQFLRDARGEGLDDAVQLQGGVEYLRNKHIAAGRSLQIETSFESDSSYQPIESEEAPEEKRVDDREIVLRMSFEDSPYTVLSSSYRVEESIRSDRKKEEGNRIVRFPNIFEEESRLETGTGDITDIGEALSSPSKVVTESGIIYGINYSNIKAPNPGKIFDVRPRKIKNGDSLKGRTDLQPDGSNLTLVIKKLLEDDDQKQKFLSLVSDVLPFVSDTKVEAMPDQSLFLEILEEFEPGQDQYIPAEMLSDGTLRVLALIYLLYFSDHEKIFIEEPGRNIHPSLIANLMLKMKDAAENTDKQIFLTTHNVEVLRHTPPEDVRLVSRDEDGFTQVERPAESERVQKFLENDLGMVDLYTENMLGE